MAPNPPEMSHISGLRHIQLFVSFCCFSLGFAWPYQLLPVVVVPIIPLRLPSLRELLRGQLWGSPPGTVSPERGQSRDKEIGQKSAAVQIGHLQPDAQWIFDSTAGVGCGVMWVADVLWMCCKICFSAWPKIFSINPHGLYVAFRPMF